MEVGWRLDVAEDPIHSQAPPTCRRTGRQEAARLVRQLSVNLPPLPCVFMFCPVQLLSGRDVPPLRGLMAPGNRHHYFIVSSFKHYCVNVQIRGSRGGRGDGGSGRSLLPRDIYPWKIFTGDIV